MAWRRHVREWIGKPGQDLDAKEWLAPLAAEETVVHPESKAKILIMLLTFVLLMYIIVAVPYIIGFEVELKEESRPWYNWELFVDAFFWLDIGVNFRTGIIEEDGHVVMMPADVFTRYLFSKDFVFDAAVSFPFDLCFEGGGGDAAGVVRVARIFKAVKILRLNKLCRGPLYEQYEDARAKSTMLRFCIKLTSMLLMMIMCFHWVGCTWALTASVAPHGQNWVTKCDERAPLRGRAPSARGRARS